MNSGGFKGRGRATQPTCLCLCLVCEDKIKKFYAPKKISISKWLERGFLKKGWYFYFILHNLEDKLLWKKRDDLQTLNFLFWNVLKFFRTDRKWLVFSPFDVWNTISHFQHACIIIQPFNFNINKLFSPQMLGYMIFHN